MNIAHDLFLLMFNLTQVQDRAKLIEMFLGGLHEIFEPAVFEFTKESTEEAPLEIEIRTRRSHFGFIRFTKFKDAPKEHLQMLQNATQMLAVMLERLYFDRQLHKEKDSLEQIAEERNKELKKKIKELEQARNATLNLVEDLNHEITQRTKYEKELKQSEEKFRSLFRDHSAVKLLIDPDNGDIAEANKAAANFYGWSVDELERMNISQINTLPADQIKKEIVKVRENLKTSFEFKHRKADGSICDVETYSSRMQIGDKVLLHSIVHDISEKKKVEEQLKLISRSVEQNPVGILITDAKGIIEYTNPAFTQITGYAFEEVKRENPSILQSGEHSKAFYKELWDTILNGRDWEGEFHNKKKNGEYYWEQAVISPIVNEEGKITHFVGIKEDVTEKKRIFEDLKQAKEKAEESDSLKTAFLANMSHEIRTPMNGILGFTNLLMDPDLTSEEKDQYIEFVHKGGQRMMNTVNDIVEISKIEAGVVGVEKEAFNVNQVMKEIVEFLRPEAQKKALSLKIDQFLPEDASTLHTDKNKLESILTNLIKNAIKYTDSGHINVSCRLKNNYAEFYVSDTGIGVPKHRRDAIFNRFEQADISDTRAFQGSGLGLAISKSYVEMLGGEIWLESEENKGSTFYFSVPVSKGKKSKPPEGNKKQSKDAPAKKTEAPDKKLKILVAEDDEDSFLYLKTVLKKINCKIIQTITGSETVEKARKHPDIDLILMDIKLPDKDGYEATREIREFNTEVPILAQTAYAMVGDKAKALNAGCDDYIAKPIKRKELMEKINTVLKNE